MGYKEEKQHQLDMRYLRMARIWAENSYCVRRKVGALIVKDKMIISDGYNGTPAGFENICEDETGSIWIDWTQFGNFGHQPSLLILPIINGTFNAKDLSIFQCKA